MEFLQEDSFLLFLQFNTFPKVKAEVLTNIAEEEESSVPIKQTNNKQQTASSHHNPIIGIYPVLPISVFIGNPNDQPNKHLLDLNLGNGVSAGTATLPLDLQTKNQSGDWILQCENGICQHGCQLLSTCLQEHGNILGK